jgi:hypothetical protein
MLAVLPDFPAGRPGERHLGHPVITWNLRHIAGGRVRLAMARLKKATRIHVPVICTPEELLELEDQL